jgi:class 3 adenylate cyclase
MDDFPPSDAWLETAAHEKHPIAGALSLGRAESNSLHLTDAGVSRRHAVLHRQPDGEFWLVDLGSVNGTYLNGLRIFQPVKLRDGDCIAVAGHAFVFRQTGPPQAPAQAASPTTRLDLRAASVWLLLADIENFTPLSCALPPDRLAVLLGSWFLACQKIVEEQHGRIYKYLGDGFLAYWIDDEASTARVAAAARAFATVVSDPRFRFVIHRGSISMGGCPVPGEEVLLGSVVNFVFRMERLAAQLRMPVLLSEEANGRLAARLATTPLASHSLKGFEGNFSFFVPAFHGNTPTREA